MVSVISGAFTEATAATLTCILLLSLQLWFFCLLVSLISPFLSVIFCSLCPIPSSLCLSLPHLSLALSLLPPSLSLSLSLPLSFSFSPSLFLFLCFFLSPFLLH